MPAALLVSGPPASGKTVLGRSLARELVAAYLDLDTLTGPLVEVVGSLMGTSDLDDRRLAAATRQARYRTLTDVAVDCVQVGRPVVVAAPFTRERREIGAFRSVTEQLTSAGGDPTLVWIRIEPAELISRLRQRGAPRDHRKLSVPGRYLASLDLDPPAVPHLVVDAAQPATMTAQVLEALRGLA